MTFGVILLVSSWFYLIMISFQNDFGWGLCSIFLPMISYVYACFVWNKGKEVVLMGALGTGLILFGL